MKAIKIITLQILKCVTHTYTLHPMTGYWGSKLFLPASLWQHYKFHIVWRMVVFLHSDNCCLLKGWGHLPPFDWGWGWGWGGSHLYFGGGDGEHLSPVYLLFGAVYWSSKLDNIFKGCWLSHTFERGLTSICGGGTLTSSAFITWCRILIRQTVFRRLICYIPRTLNRPKLFKDTS